VSSWLDLDGANVGVQRDSETALKQELSWAAHLSMQVGKSGQRDMSTAKYRGTPIVAMLANLWVSNTCTWWAF
jgi:hypothetical protein